MTNVSSFIFALRSRVCPGDNFDGGCMIEIGCSVFTTDLGDLVLAATGEN
jgi:hypothetical protein